MKLAMAQLNSKVGDIAGNVESMKRSIRNISEKDVDLVVFSELFISGYPPRDLIQFSWFIERIEDAIDDLLSFSTDFPELGILFGAPRRTGSSTGKGLVNSALLIQNGDFLFEQDKCLLPNYDVFDETRYFDPYSEKKVRIYKYKGEKLGISICEDAWNDKEFEDTVRYDFNPIEILANQGATVLINIAASPFQLHKEISRFNRSSFHAAKWHIPYVAVGQVGANDELIFDGSSVAVDRNGRLITSSKSFKEDLAIVDLNVKGESLKYEPLTEMEAFYEALTLGLRDYMTKSGFKKVVLGLSGGIDSALVAAIAVNALGAKNVHGVTMPSHYSSTGSVEDSKKLASNLGISIDEIPIKGIFDSFESELESPFAGLPKDVTEENLQARIRGTLLMAYSNKMGALLLATGNKSEIAVGYCTLYGDMNGGLAVISDLYKTTVYELSRWINRNEEIIPEEIINKAPSAELAPNQKDQDSLPEYDILDGIIKLYLEEGRGIKEIVEAGFEKETVEWVIKTINKNEYKRHQAAPGLRVTKKSFGSGRRMPIAAIKE